MWSLTFGGIKQIAFCATVTFILNRVVVVSAQDFGYEGQHGPQHWAEDFKRCSGKFQSPINIDELSVVEKEFPDLEYNNIDVIPKRVHMGNNGHTVVVKMKFEKGREPSMMGGPLERKSQYQFEQFHFHWGQNDTVGSEDLVNNHAYPAELHVVMRSLDFKDFQSALGQDHGVAVLAFFFSIDEEDNPNYEEFVKSLSIISGKGMWITLQNLLPLSKFLSWDLVSYYSYVGSLTTPPCAEKVVWIDFQIAIPISEKQINHFRELTLHDYHLRNNFRPPQPINDRIIYENVPRKFVQLGYSAIPFVNADNAAEKCSKGGGIVLILVCYVINSLFTCTKF
ncbi:carbonic anhydrase 1-like [Drosophila innubila]|uniref:carbonic anhydrase 1-like n=1 Tax=Drosophila innubila TaxID=198719 RepID=UPI00148B583A|nr:carbonic anhydrase 1-like [Drosophila innubila]